MSSLSAPQGASRSHTDYGEHYVEHVRHQIQADDAVLGEARRRRDRVRALAERYDGALRSFPSGSLAHGTVNEPVKDADSGMILDRRSWPQLGPGGAGLGPVEIVTEVARFVHRGLITDWPKVTYTINKRAILYESMTRWAMTSLRRIHRLTWSSASLGTALRGCGSRTRTPSGGIRQTQSGIRSC